MQDYHLKSATSELRTLLEQFANSQSMVIIFDAANTLIKDAQHDVEFRNWFKDLNACIRNVISPMIPFTILRPNIS
jgi:hypothetical protein